MSGANHPAVINLQNYLKIRSVHPNINYVYEFYDKMGCPQYPLPLQLANSESYVSDLVPTDFLISEPITAIMIKNECIRYLQGQAKELGLTVQVFEPVPKKPVLVMTWEGLEPTLPSILLNSHMDVVPVFEESWTHPPFAAEIVDGVIYARGVQDMKSVGVQYIEAVRRLKAKTNKLKRTVHLSFVPDEEIGGRTGMAEFVKTDGFKNLNVGFALDEGMASPDENFLVFNCERTIYHEEISSGTGMAEFVKTEDFKNLNVGFALDEGMASPDENFLVFNCERTTYYVRVTCPGKSGHGSLLLPDNAGEKLRYIIDKFMDLRQESKKKLADDPTLTIGDVTSVNLTMLSGGIQDNVVPEKLSASFDVRLASTLSPEGFENLLSQWCTEAGRGVSVEFTQRDTFVPPTPLDDSNIYWKAFLKATNKQLRNPPKRRTFPGGTDSRYLREKGIPAVGFSPISSTVPGLHEHDERLEVNVFLRGIELYEAIVYEIACA